MPLFTSLFASTHGALLMSLDRYIAVVYPVWQNNNVCYALLYLSSLSNGCGQRRVCLPFLS